MDDLIAQLEAAIGPSSELNDAIALAIGMKMFNMDTGAEVASGPNYTHSIDAALTLLGEIDVLVLERCLQPDMGGKQWRVVLGRKGARSRAPTPALALCIAALKARSAKP